MFRASRLPVLVVLIGVCALVVGCEDARTFDPADPARGPGGLVGNELPITNGQFTGGNDSLPTARDVVPVAEDKVPDCDGDCRRYCDGLSLKNPVNRGLCTSLWGVGLEPRPIVGDEACRRLYVDMTGRFPTYREVKNTCQGRGWDEVVKSLIDSEEFVFINQRRWSDRFLYHTQTVSVERIFDMDRLVGKLYRGEVAYDLFAAVASAHPVMTRRYDTAADRAEALFNLFLGRPPLGHERSDMARLYVLWTNGYYDHPQLGMRLPDAFIRYRCLDNEGKVDPGTKGECTSILYGYNELILTPDIRTGSSSDQMWSGLIKSDEWSKLQLPGRLLSQQQAFWEKAVDDVLDQYLGYELGTQVPAVRDELVRYLLDYEGDIRAVHYAVATSVAYLQSSTGNSPTTHRWAWGPLKQVEAEVWIDTLKHTTGYNLSECDHRLSSPNEFTRSGSIGAVALLQNTRWELRDDGNVQTDYRDLAQNLGGCPVNDAGRRFKIVSILTTAMQLNFVNRVCNAGFDARIEGAEIERLLPGGVNADRLVTEDLAEKIVRFQTENFFGRAASSAERREARENGELCERERCRAVDFARPACFALLSSAEMLFY
ncbi:MAG: hypothetical protein H0U74_07920 [Bradymonadaceae bacterium]|nr:hypothetical protein [Lujinxingiaceae bacterium]